MQKDGCLTTCKGSNFYHPRNSQSLAAVSDPVLCCTLQASLLLSPVPTLHGNFPLSVSLVLRMLSLVAATCNASLGKKADLATKNDMLRILQHPFYAAGKDPALQQKMQHLFRFAVDYLMRQRMLTLTAR